MGGRGNHGKAKADRKERNAKKSRHRHNDKQAATKSGF
jgi:hypothetical protein